VHDRLGAGLRGGEEERRGREPRPHRRAGAAEEARPDDARMQAVGDDLAWVLARGQRSGEEDVGEL
jgi:hypothetical protein